MDKIEICNMALARIGAETIERLDENSEQARACKQFYDSCRRGELRNFPWTFATRRTKLALELTEPFDYKYAYRYPSAALYIRRLFSADRGWLLKDVKHQIISDQSGKLILTDLELAGCEYTADIEDTELFDTEFCDALAWRIGSEIAVRVTGNVQLANYCQSSYSHFMLEARADSENEHNPDKLHVNELIAARFCGLDYDDPTRHYD